MSGEQISGSPVFGPPPGSPRGPMPPPFGAAPPGSPSQQGRRPASVRLAVRLMVAHAVVSALGLVVLWVARDSLRSRIRDTVPSYDARQMDTVVDVSVAITVVAGLLGVVLYLVLAWQLSRGRNWARIVTWVWAGLGLLGAVVMVLRPGVVAGLLLELAAGALDLAIIVLLARQESSAWFVPRPVAPRRW